MKFRLLVCMLPAAVLAQGVNIDNTGSEENPKPTWETQRQARTYTLAIPAPRGQITDRNGRPLAQNRLSYNLAINFPTPLDWTEAKVLSFARQQITLAKGLLKREIQITDQAILSHYKNRGVLPLDIVEDLLPTELSVIQGGLPSELILRQTYARFYPNGSLASHIIGYTGREAPLSLRPIENNDFIFPESEGREGLEQIFDNELRGQPGILHITYGKDGRKMSERIARQPVPGYNVISTIDDNLQRLCEKVLAENTKRGALVIIEPSTGEILAMASHPGFNPNDFVPIVKPAIFEAFSKDPSDPLVPRAFRSAYPAGSTFKTFVGFAALNSGKIKPKDEFNCPADFTVGDHTFKNWKKSGAGMLNFKEALTQSCNTWFYQVGIKIGAPTIIEYANRLGLGRRTGIPVKSETEGNIPTDEYMMRVHKRVIKKGDVANMAIGQGDILISPLQMTQAMGVISQKGVFHQTRLVKQVQTIDNRVIAAYPDRVRDEIPVAPEMDEVLRKALVAVTSDGQGTAHQAQVKGIQVAGKTGTAQWGPTNKQRTAAWFTGFLPADNPRYAFAALYEGEPNDNTVHGGSHAAPIIGKLFKQVFAAPGKSGDSEPEPETPAADESN
ncbi:MAG: penicillin-binding protein 2 [Verrucomicrobiaceae bacterium]|nr:MAG: penicillin-binding protein 2 [Verrucomicrobiaceae bacterium]